MAYLVLQMVDLVAVFSGTASPEDDDNGDAAKALRLAQMVVGLAAVFHRAAAGAAPRANWRVYAVYAACFAIMCACARVERRKKAYLAGTDRATEEWKKSGADRVGN
jgi:Zn-dependent oligopeptidase